VQTTKEDRPKPYRSVIVRQNPVDLMGRSHQFDHGLIVIREGLWINPNGLNDFGSQAYRHAKLSCPEYFTGMIAIPAVVAPSGPES
jgi:hypothetical protein